MMHVRNLRIGLAAAALLAVVSVPVGAQRMPMNYTVITFRKVAPEKVDAFLAFTRDQTKKVMQARLDSGGIKSWSLVKLTMPYAMASDYNYAMVVSTDKFPDLDPAAPEMDAVYSKVGINRAAYLKMARELSTPVSQQITRTALRVGSAAQAGDYVRVDYHSTPSDRPGELMELEATVYAPMFKAVIEANKGIKAWTVAMPVLPTATEADYSFYTTQVFKDSASLGAGAGTSPAVFQKVHPDRNYLNVMQRVRTIDKLTKVRIYHVLDVLGGPIMPAATN
jgi:hypothetical protein